MQAVSVQEMIDNISVYIEYGEEYSDRLIYSSEVSRPGLILTGYRDHFPHERIQLIGRTEMSYLELKTSEERYEIFDTMCTEDTPAIVVSRNMPIPKELIDVANKYHVPILSTRSKTSRALSNITNFLESRLAERISIHGVFVEVFGMGVLLKGDSGVGKSETGLELIQRGHRLVADDRVEFYQVDERTLIGEAPEILRNLIEIRGLGIIDVMHLYGVSAVRISKRLELIIELMVDDGSIEYERLGFEQETEQIFDVVIPKVRIPVKTGRNLSTIVESAAMNHRTHLMGFDAKKTFHERLAALIKQNSENDK